MADSNYADYEKNTQTSKTHTDSYFSHATPLCVHWTKSLVLKTSTLLAIFKVHHKNNPSWISSIFEKPL